MDGWQGVLLGAVSTAAVGTLLAVLGARLQRAAEVSKAKAAAQAKLEDERRRKALDVAELVGAVRAELSGVHRRLDDMGRAMVGLGAKLDDQASKLDEHGRKLDDHGHMLERQAEAIKEQGAKLDDHAAEELRLLRVNNHHPPEGES